jgi:hypothetical protein
MSDGGKIYADASQPAPTPLPMTNSNATPPAGGNVPPPSSYMAGGFDNPPGRPLRVPDDSVMGRDAGWMAYAAATEAERQSRLKAAAVAAGISTEQNGEAWHEPTAPTAPEAMEVIARTQVGLRAGVSTTVTRAPRAEVIDALLDALPEQITTATQFALSSDGRIDLVNDPPGERGTIDTLEHTHYEELRHKSIGLATLGHNQLGDLFPAVSRFVTALPEQIEQVSIIRLWSRGNTLRSRLNAHDIAGASSDPTDPARLPPLVGETLRDVVETFNVFIRSDPRGRELDQVRFGPQDQEMAPTVIRTAAPIVEAIRNADGVATEAVVQALTDQLEAAQDRTVTRGIHADRATALANKTIGNFVAHAVRTACAAILAKMAAEPGFALKEYRAGIYRAAGTATFAAATAAGIVAFIAENAEALKAFAERAFDNPALVRAIELIAKTLGSS